MVVDKNYIFLNGEYIELKKAKVSPFDRGFNFGDGVYEAILSLGRKLFTFDEHIKRLDRSLKELEIDFDTKDLKKICQKLLKKNNLLDKTALIYMQVTRGASKRSHKFPEGIQPSIFIYTDLKESINRKSYAKGCKAVTTKDIRWSRCDIKSLNLIPNVMANEFAFKNDAYEAIFIRNGVITEGSHTNVFVVKDSVVYTHKANGKILKGITRDLVFSICKKRKIIVKEKAFKYKDFLKADEIFLTGTTTHVYPVLEVDGVSISKKIGKVTKKIQDDYFNLLLD